MFSEGFREGMLVALRSGGPLMTVQNVRLDRNISTVWFDSGALYRDTFAPEDLYRYEKMAD